MSASSRPRIPLRWVSRAPGCGGVREHCSASGCVWIRRHNDDMSARRLPARSSVFLFGLLVPPVQAETGVSTYATAVCASLLLTQVVWGPIVQRLRQSRLPNVNVPVCVGGATFALAFFSGSVELFLGGGPAASMMLGTYFVSFALVGGTIIAVWKFGSLPD